MLTSLRRLALHAAALVLFVLPADAQIRSGADFSGSTAVASRSTVHPRETVDFDVTVANRGTAEPNWIEIENGIPTGALLVSYPSDWRRDPDKRSIRWSGRIAPGEKKQYRVTLIAQPETEGSRLSNDVAIRYEGNEYHVWTNVDVDTMLAPPLIRLGRFGITRAGAVVLGFLATLAIAATAAAIVVRLSATGGVRLPGARMPGLVSATILVVICLGFLTMFGFIAAEDHRILTEWREAKATVLDADVAIAMLSSATRTSSGATRSSEVATPHFAVRYATPAGEMVSVSRETPSKTKRGGGFAEAAAALASAAPGATVRVWYDPADPQDVVLARGYGGAYFFALLPIGVLALALTLWVAAFRAARRPARR